MFQENYKKAYDSIIPDSVLVEKMLEMAEEATAEEKDRKSVV